MTQSKPLVAPVEFRSYPYFMAEMRAGRKNFDIRRFDPQDARHVELSLQSIRPWGTVSAVDAVTFVNTENNLDTVTFKFLGMSFCEHLPGWCILRLGPKVRDSRDQAEEKKA